MTRTISANGIDHEFPDDASNDDISEALASYDKEQKFNKFKEMLSQSPSGAMAQGAKDISGGALSGMIGTAKLGAEGLKGMIPAGGLGQISNLLPGQQQKQLSEAISGAGNAINKFDPYKAMGTENKPFDTVGGALQMAGGLLPGGNPTAQGIKAIPGLIEKVSPGKSAQELLQHLGGGAENTQQATKSIVQDIQRAHDSHEAQAVAHLKFPLEQAGKEKIYDFVDPLITTKMDKAKPLMSRVKDLNVGDLFTAFEKNPSFENAHNLQSELGTMIGDLKKIPGKTPAESKQLNDISSVRDDLKSHINEFLEKRDKTSNQNLLPQYQKGIDLYRENVAPYLSNTKLRQIVRERRTAVPNVHKLFESPYDLVEKLTGKEKEGPITKILSDLPQDTKNKILFRKVNANTNAKKPNKLVESLEKAEQQGYAHLYTPEIKKGIMELEKKAKNQNALKWIGGSTVGATGLGLLEEYLRRHSSNNA